MAQITSISNGEALSSVRTKLNDVITNVNLLDPTDWVDYSATSTIVGWSSRTTTLIRYRIIGKQMFVQFNLIGTSNSTSVTFTLPNNSVNLSSSLTHFGTNNGVNVGVCHGTPSGNSNVITLYASAVTAAWTGSGSKSTRGQFFIEIA
jgi:hypothetical protein